MTKQRSYASPEAFRRALTDKLREVAGSGRWDLPQLQRQMAYDRLLERLYLGDEEWVVKGATALIARQIGVRATIGIDVYRARPQERAEADLREASSRDVGDWFRFELGPTQPVTDGTGVRIPVTAYVGTSVWASFHVDLVGSDMRMTGEPEDVQPLARVNMPDVEQHGYRAYPLADHIADKIAAIFQRYGDRGMPSTRYKDLVDLVAIVTAASVAADQQVIALASEAQRRGLTLPIRLDVPDRRLWERGYTAEAGRSLLLTARTLDEALGKVGPFVDPILAGTAAGDWDPNVGAWTG